jgi:hypothetical protein
MYRSQNYLACRHSLEHGPRRPSVGLSDTSVFHSEMSELFSERGILNDPMVDRFWRLRVRYANLYSEGKVMAYEDRAKFEVYNGCVMKVSASGTHFCTCCPVVWFMSGVCIRRACTATLRALPHQHALTLRLPSLPSPTCSVSLGCRGN